MAEATKSNWIEDALIYQIYPLSFNYAEGSKSDPHEGAYGNIKGITAKADYVKSLGVDAVWICPFYESPLKIGLGYNATDYCKIEPTFGTMDDFKEMVNAFHDRGIKVIIDQVYNHTDITHEWFQKSRDWDNPEHPENKEFKNYYVWADAKYDEQGNRMPPNNWYAQLSEDPSAWQWDEHRKQYYLHSFNNRLPDLNLNEKEVRDAIKKVSEFWLEQGVDGFRLDAASHYGNDPQLRDNPLSNEGWQYTWYNVNQDACRDMLKDLRDMVDTADVRQIGVPKGAPYKPNLLCEYLNEIKPEHVCGGEGAHSYYRGVLVDGPEQHRGLKSFRQDVEYSLSLSPDGRHLNWAMSNHDMPRIVTRWFGENATEEHAKLAMSLLMSLPGNICVYQGEELGLDNPDIFSVKRQPEEWPTYDPLELSADAKWPTNAARVPMAFGAEKEKNMWFTQPESHQKLSVAKQEQNPDSMLAFTRKMIKARKSTPALNDAGSLTFIDTDQPEMVAFVRKSAKTNDEMLCAFNFTDKPMELKLPEGMVQLGDYSGERGRTMTIPPLKSHFAKVMMPAKSAEDVAARSVPPGLAV